VAGPGRARWARVLLLAAALAVAAAAARAAGLWELLSLDNLARLRQWIDGHGAWGPLLFVVGYALAELCFVPALPITLLGGVAFGPLRGTVYVAVGATLGAALAFLAARYAMRGAVERWVAGNPRLQRIDAAVAEHGWRLLMITRLVPLFPFNLQNFAYGLTRISFRTFLAISFVCMLPGTAAYTFAAGALVDGRGDLGRTLVYLGVAGVLLVGLSLLPRLLVPRSRAAGDLLGSR
jgi:uncharacterized membrane protein YdjX (TVP38/TMEM64 family)